MQFEELLKKLKSDYKDKSNKLSSSPVFTLDYLEGFEQGAKYILRQLKKYLKDEQE